MVTTAQKMYLSLHAADRAASLLLTFRARALRGRAAALTRRAAVLSTQGMTAAELSPLTEDSAARTTLATQVIALSTTIANAVAARSVEDEDKW